MIMKNTCVIGASGYTGVELIKLILAHPELSLAHAFVSSGSDDAHKLLNELYPSFTGVSDITLTPLPGDTRAEADLLASLATSMDVIFLATPHQASHDWMPHLLDKHAKVIDLSGAFRLSDPAVFEQYYGFTHKHQDIQTQSVYGLVDWNEAAIAAASVVAAPGCYPTATLLALKPLQAANLIDCSVPAIVNAVSGVSGAGRKPSLTTSLCEVSLQAYGVLKHRHQPEIKEHLGAEVIFTPHLGNFKRGILATCTLKLQHGTSQQQVDDAFYQAYLNNSGIKLLDSWPKLDDVVHSPFCHLHWQVDEDTGYAVVSSAIDNLLKGAASQAVQCANLMFGKPKSLGLWPEVHS